MKAAMEFKRLICAELESEPLLGGAEIAVEVHEGVASLTGTVDSDAEKLLAERIARGVPGIEGIVCELKVQLPEKDRRADAKLAQSVIDVLKLNTSFPGKSIKVLVEGRRVTLSGDVAWPFQRQAAVDAVRFLFGVRGVKDLIEIKPPPSLKRRRHPGAAG